MAQLHIDEIRSFNRFYTGVIGLLNGYILDSNYTLPEVRILYEVYHNENMTSRELILLLNIDKGYLSRILLQFERKKMISKTRSQSDKRSTIIALTAKGEKEFETLNTASNSHMKKILEAISKEDYDKLLFHMAQIKKIFSGSHTKKK